VRVELVVNGVTIEDDVEPRVVLVEWLRRRGSKGTHVGCDTSSCGACTVLLDGMAVKSCTILTVQASGSQVVTIEGIGTSDEPSPVQRAFAAEHGLQCGFCTPGFVIAATALLETTPRPSKSEIVDGLEGNLCRCTGYTSIIRAVEYASALRRGANPLPIAGRAHEVPLARSAVRGAPSLEDLGDAEVV
jgi:carbon-monoxide dehydrogenase small subunit